MMRVNSKLEGWVEGAGEIPRCFLSLRDAGALWPATNADAESMSHSEAAELLETQLTPVAPVDQPEPQASDAVLPTTPTRIARTASAAPASVDQSRGHPTVSVVGLSRETRLHTDDALARSGSPQGDGGGCTTQISGSDVRIEGCQGSFIYLLAAVRHVRVSQSSDCTIVIGACAGAVSMFGCERCDVTLACRSLSVARSAACRLHLISGSPPLVSMQTCRGITLAPHSTFYPCLGAHLALAGLAIASNSDESANELASRNYWGAARSIPSGEEAEEYVGAVARLPPSDFALRLVPFQFAAAGLPGATCGLICGLPTTYASAVQAHRKRVEAIRLTAARLTQQQATATAAGPVEGVGGMIPQPTEQQPEAGGVALETALHSRFKEWLEKTGKLAEVSDLLTWDASMGILSQRSPERTPNRS